MNPHYFEVITTLLVFMTWSRNMKKLIIVPYGKYIVFPVVTGNHRTILFIMHFI